MKPIPKHLQGTISKVRHAAEVKKLKDKITELFLVCREQEELITKYKAKEKEHKDFCEKIIDIIQEDELPF